MGMSAGPLERAPAWSDIYVRVACDAALTLDPDLVPARFTLAEAAAAQGEFQVAVNAYRTLVERYPENIKGRLGLARVLS